MQPHIYFVRHGQTFWNVDNKVCGQTDIGLTEEGHRQAIELGRKVKNELDDGEIRFDEILCSPLSRARDTAQHIADETGIKLTVEPRLIEQNFGRYEGTARDGAEFQVSKTHFADSYSGGESMLKLAQRIYNLLDDIKERETKTGKIYMLVAHNGIARVVKSYFYDMTNEEYSACGIKNCEIIRLDYK